MLPESFMFHWDQEQTRKKERRHLNLEALWKEEIRSEVHIKKSIKAVCLSLVTCELNVDSVDF